MTRAKIAIAAGMVVAFLLLGVAAAHWRDQRDDLIAALSGASHAVDDAGRPRVLSTAEAITVARSMGDRIDATKRAAAEAKAEDARANLKVERQDAQTSQEVSADVLAQITHTRADLVAARSRAGSLLRQLDQARAASGGGGAAVSYDPEPACRAYAATDCDGLLAKLAAAEEQTQQLLGWQHFYPALKANHDGVNTDPALPEQTGRPEAAYAGGDDVGGSAARAP